MKNTLHITAAIDQPGFLADIVEKLAYRRNDFGDGKQKMRGCPEALETSSTESYVSGNMAIHDSGGHINMPFITRFVFTCIKGKDSYKLEWSSSLS